MKAAHLAFISSIANNKFRAGMVEKEYSKEQIMRRQNQNQNKHFNWNETNERRTKIHKQHLNKYYHITLIIGA